MGRYLIVVRDKRMLFSMIRIRKFRERYISFVSICDVIFMHDTETAHSILHDQTLHGVA